MNIHRTTTKCSAYVSGFLLCAMVGSIYIIPYQAHAQLDTGTAITTTVQAAPTSVAEALQNITAAAPVTNVTETLSAAVAQAAPQYAGAQANVAIPTKDLGNILTNILNGINAAANTAAATVTAKATNWDFWKTYVGDPLAKLALRLIIREMKRMTINYILTGNFGAPMFVTDFQLDIKQAAENAARSYLSQLSGINFCGFFPAFVPAVYSFNFNFQLVCAVNSSSYAQFLQDPVSMTEVERLLAQDPSTNFIQTVISAGQNKAQLISQALIANAAQKSTGFIGEVVNQKSHQDMETYNKAKQTKYDQVYEQAYNDAYDRSVAAGKQFDREAAAQEAAEIASAEAAKVPEPRGTPTINTPGNVAKTLLDHSLGQDYMYPVVADEFDQAVVAIIDTLAWKIVTTGLNGIFRH